MLALAVLLVATPGCAVMHYQYSSGNYKSSLVVDGRYVSSPRTIRHESVAVAEIGKQQPADSLVWEARWLDPYFDRAIAVSGGPESKPAQWEPPSTRFSSVEQYNEWESARAERAAVLEAKQMRAAADAAIQSARAGGARYLLLAHSSAIASRESTPATWLCLLNFPFWIVPTEAVHATGDATLALIDTAAGTVLFVTSVNGKQDSLNPYMQFYSPVPEHLMRLLHRQLFDRLKNDLTHRG